MNIKMTSMSKFMEPEVSYGNKEVHRNHMFLVSVGQVQHLMYYQIVYFPDRK